MKKTIKNVLMSKREILLLRTRAELELCIIKPGKAGPDESSGSRSSILYAQKYTPTIVCLRPPRHGGPRSRKPLAAPHRVARFGLFEAKKQIWPFFKFWLASKFLIIY